MIIRFTILIIAFSCLFSKQVIAVLDLDAINYTQEEAQVITTKIISEIINLNVYNVVERSNINRILSEQKLQNSGCTDSECAVEVGQLINADLIVIGSVSNFKELYSIDTKLINIETGEIIKIASFASEIDQKELFTKGVYDIASQISGIKSNKKYKSKSVDGRKKFAIELGYLNNRRASYANSAHHISSGSCKIKYNTGDISIGYGIENNGFEMKVSSDALINNGLWIFTYHALSLDYKLNNMLSNVLRNSLIDKILYKINIIIGLKGVTPFNKINETKDYQITCIGDECEPYIFNKEDVKESIGPTPYIELSYNINKYLSISISAEDGRHILNSGPYYSESYIAISALKLGYSF